MILLNYLAKLLLFPYHFPAGDPSGGATPDPIPNSVVKTSSADGTAVKTVGEQVVASLFFTAVGANTLRGNIFRASKLRFGCFFLPREEH